MKKLPVKGLKRFIFLFASLLLLTSVKAQKRGKIDWSRDTISRTDAMGAKKTYINTIKGSGQKPTEQINLPVDKLKEIIDACAANNVTDVSVIIVTIRKDDIKRYRRNNPSLSADVTDNVIQGSQTLVFKIPRRAFADSAKEATRLSLNPSLMTSLAGAGLVLFKKTENDPQFKAEYIYFSFGSICPPPTSCDADEDAM